MTLGDGKRKVLMLLDEYSSGGEITIDEDIKNKMNDFFDMAQKDIANVKPVIKEIVINIAAGSISDGEILCELPSDFKSYFRIWKKGKLVSPYPVRSGKLIAPKGETGAIIVEYFAYPRTIDTATGDNYIFEVAEDAANCLPFYVAAQQFITDLVVDYRALWDMYLMHKQALSPSLPSGGRASVRQSLYR